MGKRKKSAASKPQPRKIPKLETEFDCPFCNHKKTVACIINKKQCFGTIKCDVCEAHYSTKTHNLTEAIDIFHEWIDESQLVNA